ncbi:hypothetical protein [uncultured Reyranella sp.]|uniref:hypothetical protein n=1 Tax=uncultured Reyranella sp. TaxID=735512 RepID=UPI00259CE2B8|nr:hypothetical protein [uncultured Reyranella sp.]
MTELTRTNELQEVISTVIDRNLILIDSERDLSTLIGIKISLIKYRNSRVSHKNAVEDILEKHTSRKFVIPESDRLRLKNLILPRINETLLIWDSASREVPFWAAVELFNADLQYLLSDELSEHLPVTCAAARAEVLEGIRTSRLHRGFGKGSKVSKKQYDRLVRATAGGWMRHLVELGVKAEAEPVYELGELQGHGNALVEEENDLLPWEVSASRQGGGY